MINKKLGQHFLVHNSSIKKIVQLADISDRDTVIEIGPGRGALTDEIVETGARIIAVELDDYLCSMLKIRYTSRKTVDIIHEDILTISIKDLLRANHIDAEKIILMGNIPFSISSPLLDVIIREYAYIERAVLMFQKEFADRLLALPGKASYGKLSVIAELYFKRTYGFIVSKEMFRPQPKVDACVIQLVPRTVFPVPVLEHERELFKSFLGHCFAYKRKTLFNSIHESLRRTELHYDKPTIMKVISTADLNPGARAEQLSIEQFWKLFGIMKYMLMPPDIK
jgi:16S rRNA (adenine1518-N6/adenine1519-N6)-dimethyltransferase